MRRAPPPKGGLRDNPANPDPDVLRRARQGSAESEPERLFCSLVAAYRAADNRAGLRPLRAAFALRGELSLARSGELLAVAWPEGPEGA